MPQLAAYVAMLHRAEQTLADSFRTIGTAHADESDVAISCELLATLSDEHVGSLAPIAERYGEQSSGADVEEPERLHADGLAEGRSGPVGLLRDLQDLYVLASLMQTTWTVIYQAAQGVRDDQLIESAKGANANTSRQLAWLNTRLKAAAPQALLT